MPTDRRHDDGETDGGWAFMVIAEDRNEIQRRC
jgi:hypothetical protein